MGERLLFISRKAPGYGGMQRLTKDLIRAFSVMEGVALRVCVPYNQCDLSFPLRTLYECVRAMIIGSHIHLGDAALASLGALLNVIGRSHVTVTACGLDVIYPDPLYQCLIRWSLPRLDRVIAISHATAEEVRRRGVAEEKISFIPCGIWPEECRAMNNDRARGPILLSIGRLIPRKGFAWFIQDVLPKLLTKFPTLKYFIIGSGKEEKLIKKIIQIKNFGGHVVLLGSASNSTREELLQQADHLIVPNVHVDGDMEGFGIVCIEASARGLPVVAARLEGLTDAVSDRETGRLFESGNAEQCAHTICALLEHPLSPASVSETTLRTYSWEKLIPRYYNAVFRAR